MNYELNQVNLEYLIYDIFYHKKYNMISALIYINKKNYKVSIVPCNFVTKLKRFIVITEILDLAIICKVLEIFRNCT